MASPKRKFGKGQNQCPPYLGWGHCWIIGGQDDSRKPKSLPAIYLALTPFMRAKQSSPLPAVTKLYSIIQEKNGYFTN